MGNFTDSGMFVHFQEHPNRAKTVNYGLTILLVIISVAAVAYSALLSFVLPPPEPCVTTNQTDTRFSQVTGMDLIEDCQAKTESSSTRQVLRMSCSRYKVTYSTVSGSINYRHASVDKTTTTRVNPDVDSVCERKVYSAAAVAEDEVASTCCSSTVATCKSGDEETLPAGYSSQFRALACYYEHSLLTDCTALYLHINKTSTTICPAQPSFTGLLQASLGFISFLITLFSTVYAFSNDRVIKKSTSKNEVQ